MMETGARPGECCAILVQSCDPNNRVVWIERTLSGHTYRETTKENTKLPVPLNDLALEIVKRNMRGKFPLDFLFINPVNGKGFTYRALYDAWVRYTGNEIRPYEATRHSFCTQVVPLTDGYTAQRLMRHADKRSTDNYYHAYRDTLLDVVQRKNNVTELKKTKKNPKEK
jgi:integrase